MSKKGYYLEVEITGRAKVWIKSDKLKSDKELESMERVDMQKFYSDATWDSDEIIEWDVSEVTKIERSEEIDEE